MSEFYGVQMVSREVWVKKVSESNMAEFKMTEPILASVSQNEMKSEDFLNPTWLECKMAAIIKLSQNEWVKVFESDCELVWVRVLCKMAESKMAEFKMGKFKMAAIISELIRLN